MNVFQYHCYRELIREALLEKKARFGRTFTFEKLAQACRIQRTYLSAVLSGKGHLNTDQVFLAAKFLDFSAESTHYTMLLLEFDRSVVPARKKLLKIQLDSLRTPALQAGSKVKAKPLPSPTSAQADFYLDMEAQLVHMFLTIKRYLDDVEKIRLILGLDRIVFERILKKLEQADLINIHQTKVRVLNDAFHLPSHSSLFPTYRQNMRLRALDQMTKRGESHHYSFSVLYSAREETRQKIQARFLDFISWAQELTQKDEPTDVYQINFDLVKWS